MRALCYEWFPGQIKNLPAWFKHNNDVEVSWEQIKTLFDSGINVMLHHHDGTETVGLYVSLKSFGTQG